MKKWYFSLTVKQRKLVLRIALAVALFASVFTVEKLTQWHKLVYLALYLIPLYNTSQVMAGILSFADVGIPVAVTALSNLVYSLAGVWLLTKLFNNEKILFNS